MATLSEVTTYISKRLIDPSNTAVTSAEIIDAVNQSIFFRKSQRFNFNEARSDVAITASDNSIPLPTDYLVDIGKGSLVISDNQSLWEVSKVRTEEFDFQYDSNSSGRPYIWTQRAGTALLHYTPDTDYSAVLRYLKDYDDFATNGDDNGSSSDWTTFGRNLIQYDTLSRLHGELRQDEKMEAYYSNRAEAEAQRLTNLTNQLNVTGELAVESIL